MSENNWLRKLINRFVGEISVLKTPYAVSLPWLGYTLDTSKVNYKLARELSNNTNEKYKLGAGFAKPIINTTVGFMGIPHFSHDNVEVQNELDRIENKWAGKFIRVHRNTLRDGDCFVRIGRRENKFTKEVDFDLVFIPPEDVSVIADPLNGGYSKIYIKHHLPIYDELGNIRGESILTEVITQDTIEYILDGRAPQEYQGLSGEQENPWGFIPIVHFKNEAEEFQLFGSSELEPVEPFLKAYHDTMLYAVQGAKVFARPKVKFKLQSVEKFLKDNFSDDEIKSGRIRFSDKEIFFLQEGDDVSFITADSGLEAITTLLKFIFFCIVDVSETPEFAFGTAVQSSKASVSEQMVPLARKIRRKRAMMEEFYKELMQMYIYMWGMVNNVKVEANVDIGWDEVNPRNDKEVAEAINTMINGLVNGVQAGIISTESAVEFLRQYIPSMLPYADPSGDDDERRRIAKGYALWLRIQDGQGIDEEAINNILNSNEQQ